MTTLTVTVGLPGSGKTTWARRHCAELFDAGHKVGRISRDDIREKLFGLAGYHQQPPEVIHAREEQITKLQRDIVTDLLGMGVNTVVDDTNLHPDHGTNWQALADRAGVDLVVVDHFLAVPVEECVRRQAGRPVVERVSGEVIRRMATRIVGVLTVEVM